MVSLRSCVAVVSMLAGVALAQPKIQIDTTPVDLGTIDDSGMHERRIAIRNVGDEALVLGTLRASCTCIALSHVDESMKKIPPGEEGALVVRFSPAGKRGEVLQTLTLATGDPERPEVSLRVRALVKPVIFVTPSFVRWDDLRLGEGGEAEVKIYAEKPDFAIVSGEIILDEQNMLEWSASDPVRVEQEGEELTLVVVTVGVRPGAPSGMVAGQVTLNTNDERRPQVFIRTSGEVVGDLRAEPRFVTFNRVNGGDRVERTFTLGSASGKPFKVLGFGPGGRDGKYVSGTNADEGRALAKHTITMTLTAPRENTILNGELVIKTDSKEEPEYRVPFSGVVRE